MFFRVLLFFRVVFLLCFLMSCLSPRVMFVFSHVCFYSCRVFSRSVVFSRVFFFCVFSRHVCLLVVFVFYMFVFIHVVFFLLCVFSHHVCLLASCLFGNLRLGTCLDLASTMKPGDV